MITITVYVNSDVLSWLINLQQGNITSAYDDAGNIRKVSLKKTSKMPFEVQVPVAIISQYFPKKNYATINLFRVQSIKSND